MAHAHYLVAVCLANQHDKQSQQEPYARVDRAAFFITNGEPCCFWDFVRLVWRHAGDTTRSEDAWTMTRPWALLLA